MKFIPYLNVNICSIVSINIILYNKEDLYVINTKLPFILYGCDYNPDQWPKEVIEEDIRLLN